MLNIKQQTIQKSVTISGVGLHTGVQTNMTFLPAKPNHGIKFQRVDLRGSPIISADCENVVDVSRGTTIEESGARISTIEHTLAALVGLEIDNVLIQLDGPECPIMDGSSIRLVETLKNAGTEEHDALRDFFEVQQPLVYWEAPRNVQIAGLGLYDYSGTVMIECSSPVLGRQRASMPDIRQFEKEIASCRTV